MQITHKITCLGFLLAISTLTTSISTHAATESLETVETSIEFRLSRLTEAVKQRGIDIIDIWEKSEANQLARGWGNGNRGNWVNTNRGGFANRHGGGGFVNRNWRDGGRFYNNSGGGGFVNRGGGFLNR